MPAPKRGSASPDLQPKIRKLDEDEETLPATIEPTSNSFKTENKQENTAAAPRTKKKRLAVEQENSPDKSSNQSSPTKESSKTAPDPPVKKAKLLNATSASCGETPSQRANSKVSVKLTASTDSDGDLSSDSSKVDLFRERDNEDKARCIRIYSNKIKAICSAEESSSDPQELSQDLSSSSLDPVQKDHSYGRFSESTSLENTGEAEDKDSAECFTEQKSEEISHDETQKVPTDTLVSEIGSTETSVKVESATEKSKFVELQYPESPTLMDNKTPAFSRDISDCIIPVGEENAKRDETELNKSQKGVDHTLALPEKTLRAVTGELHSSDEGAQLGDERTDSACRPANQTHLITPFVSEENEQNIKSKTKEQEVSESAEICAENLVGVLLNETAPEPVEISNVESQPEENLKMAEFATTPNTQKEISDQVASKEGFNATDIQAEMPDTLEKSEDKFEESARDFQPPQTSACAEALVEVRLNHGIVTPDGCTDTLSECMVVQNQIETLSDNFKVPEGQTPELVLQSEENYLIYDKATQVAAETERDSSGISEEKDESIQCSAAEIKGDAQTSHPDTTVKTQNLNASGSTTDFHEGHGGDSFKTMENEDIMDGESEAETAVTPEISNSEPPVETQKQEIQEVSQSTTVTSSDIHGSVAADKCENMKTGACAVIAEGQSGTETVAAFKPSDPAARVELQTQESPVNEHPVVLPDDGQESPENANSKSRSNVEVTAENLIEVDIQTAAMSEEVCAQVEETHSQMNEEVSECTIDIFATQSQIEFDELSDDSSEEVSNIAHIEEMQTPIVSESTANMHDEAQKVLENPNCAAQSQIEVVEDVQAAVTLEKISTIALTEEMQTPTVSESTANMHEEAQKFLENPNCATQSQIEVVEDAIISEKVSTIASIEEIQTPMVSEPATDTPDDAYSDVEDAAFMSGKYVKCVSAVFQNQIEVDVDTSASENVAPVEVMQSLMVSESTTDTSVDVFGNHREENLKTVANDEFKFESSAVTSNQMEVKTTLSMESSNSAPLLSVDKSQTEEDMQAPDNGFSASFGVETQTQKIQDVTGQTDNTDEELLEDKMVENVKHEDAVSSECMSVQEDQVESEMQITPDSVISGANNSEEIQKSQNETDILTVTTSEQDCNIPAVEIQTLKSHDVNEENTDTQSVADEESQNKMETSFSPPSAETQNQRSFDITDSSTDVSEQVQENFRTSTNESFENENKAIEERVPAAVRANEMETQAAEGLQENFQPTPTKQTESHRGQEVSELITDTNISVSQTSSETLILKGSDVTETENGTSVTVQEHFGLPSDECHENENKVIKESVDTAEWTNTMETQKAEMLEVSQPTAPEQTQSQRGPEVSELTTDSDSSVLPPPPETQIQRSFDITDPASEVSKPGQESFKIPSNECHENKATEEHVDDEMTNKMETLTAEMLKEDSPQTTTEQTQSWRGQELSELTTDVSVSSPSSEIQMQKSLNVESEVKISETVQTIFSITSNQVHNINEILEKSVDTAEGTNENEMQAAEMSFEASQPTTSETRQNLKGQEVSELTTDSSVSPPPPETQIQRSFDIADPASEVSKTGQDSFKIPSDCHENKATEEQVDDEMTNKMETQTAEMSIEVSQPATSETRQNLKGQEVSELTTDVSVSSPSSEIQIQESLNAEHEVKVSETVQHFSITSNEVHNENEMHEKSVDTAEGMNEMEMQATEMSFEASQPTTSETRQNIKGQEVSELTTDTNISVSLSLSETQIQMSSSVTDSANDASEVIKPNDHHENENKECVDTAERTHKMEIHAAETEVSQPTITEQTETLRHQEVSEVVTDTDVCVLPAPAETQIHISLSEASTNTSGSVQEVFRIPSNECHENVKNAIEEFADTAEMTTEMEIQTTEAVGEIFQPTATEQTQTMRGQEVSELTTDVSVSSPSTEIQIQKSLNIESEVKVSETVQTIFSITSNEVHNNENKILEKSVDAAEGTNEMEPQAAEMSFEASQPTATEQTQNLRDQEVSELTINANISASPPSAEAEMERRITVAEPASDLSKTTQGNFMIPPTETNENEHEVIDKCVDTAEPICEMEVQTEAVVEIFQPTTEQTQNQRADEVSELTIVADMSVSAPSAETKIQKINITDPTDDFSTTNQENVKIPPNENEIGAVEECVHSAERTNEMETQPAQLLQEVSQPTTTEQSQNQSNQVCEHSTDTEVENNPSNTESDKNVNSVSTFENHPTIAWQTSSTPESYQKLDSALQNQRNEEDGQMYRIEDKDASECENVPEIETNMETSAESREISYSAAVEQQNHLAKETTEHTTDLSDEIQTPSPVVHLENKENGRQTEHENVQGDVICGSKERTESVLLEDIKIAESVSNIEDGAERSEVIVFICDQSEDTDVAVQAPEDQIKTVNQSEVDFHENHVVYEPISSPESNSGGEVCTIQLGETISFLDLHSAETHQILDDGSNFLTSDDKLKPTHPKVEDEEIVKKDVCASDSQAVVLMEVETTSEAQCPAHAHSQQSNTTEDVKRIAAVGSSDISLADGQLQDATEKSVILECVSAAELTEQVQEGTGVQDATGIVTTTTTPALTEVEITDVPSEDYVILEPVRVRESEAHFDIVTQAAAESGLSASLGPDEEMTSQSVLSSAQQTETLEVGVHQGETADEVKETTVTSSGEVLEQQTEANRLQDAPVSDHLPPSASVDVDTANSGHTNKDSNAAVMEMVESVVDQEEVQILEDMEIGREIVVIEDDNDSDTDVVIITIPPDQPPETSEEKVNDEKIQDTSKIAMTTSAEKTEDERRGQEVEKPKKQEMNMQARTKARLAALAEQKAAAAKRSANRQQLNLLALCQEIAEDIATDSMLLKKIEEEKQAAAAAAEAAKAEAIEKDHPAVISQEAEPDHLATPAGPEESSASVTPTPEPPAVQPSTADSAEAKPAAEPPKRRFFISQISVPLKTHEKKKLTRYQRLRQVELQREKMSWARVKKLKSDQTNQMFSDVDWQASFSGSFLMSSTTPPPAAAASPSKTSSASPATTIQPAQAKGDSPKVETSTSELVKTGADKAESIKTENVETELIKPEATKTEPSKAEPSRTEPTKAEPSKTEPTKTEPSKAEPVKAEATKTEAPICENRRITRQSKAQASQATAVAPKPAPKVTRSSKRTLPAVPPPMPNGLNAQKQKPVEYKPYKPRPKYSFDDFELDDDDSLLVSHIKPNLPTQLPRPGLQPSPAAHAKLPQKPTVSSQPTTQAKLKPQTAPPGQVSSQSRPAAVAQAPPQSAKPKPTVTAAAQSKPMTAASSKPVPSTSIRLKTPTLAASQSKPVSASAQPKPAASASPSSQTAGVNVTKQLAPAVPQPASSAATETKPAAAEADDASAPRETENPPSQEEEKCKNAADALSSLPASSLPSVGSSYNTKKSEDSPADTTPNSSADSQSKTDRTTEKTENRYQDSEAKPHDAATFLSGASLQKEVNKLKEADKDGTQTIIDAGQKHFGPVACSGCGMLYTAANAEDEAQHLLFHNQFVSAVKYVGWKKERILAEYPDGKIILVLPDDPKYALKKVEEIREMVDNDLGFQQVETKCPSKTKTFLFISVDKKVAGCLIAEHIQEGYRVIEEPLPEGSEGEKVLFERQKAWCCSTTPEPAICGISRIWVASMMRRQGIATRMIECLRNNFIYGSYLRKDEIAFSDPTPDGKLFASHYFGTSQFLVYNFVSGPRSLQPKTQAV